MIDWQTVDGILAGVTDEQVFRQRLEELKAKTATADRQIAEAAKQQQRTDAAERLHGEAAGMLIKVAERQGELDRRERVLAAAETGLAKRQEQLAEREAAIARREQRVEQRHANLTEIVAGAAS